MKQTTKTKTSTHQQQTLAHSDTASLQLHSTIYDTVHVIMNETIWREPDTLGKQYPLKTIRRESGATRQTLSEMVIQKKDTIYLQSSTNQQSSTLNHEPLTLNQKTNTWLPWLIIAAMIIIAIIILAIRIFLIKL